MSDLGHEGIVEPEEDRHDSRSEETVCHNKIVNELEVLLKHLRQDADVRNDAYRPDERCFEH